MQDQWKKRQETGDRTQEIGGIIVTSVVGNVGMFHCRPVIAPQNYRRQCGMGIGIWS